MPLKILTIKKRSEFLHVKLKGTTDISKSLIVQKIFDEKLNNCLKVGYTATRKLGNAVQRNRAKRLMRVLVKKNLHKYGNVNFCYVMIAKHHILNTPFQELNNEFKELLLKK